MPGPKTADSKAETFGTIIKGVMPVTFKVLGWFPAANNAREVIEAAALSYLGVQRFFRLEDLTGDYQCAYSTHLILLKKDGTASYLIRSAGEYQATVEFSVNNPDSVTMVNALLFFDPAFIHSTQGAHSSRMDRD